MLLAIVYNGIWSYYGVLSNFNMIGTDNLATTQSGMVMNLYTGSRLNSRKRDGKPDEGIVLMFGMQHDAVSQRYI